MPRIDRPSLASSLNLMFYQWNKYIHLFTFSSKSKHIGLQRKHHLLVKMRYNICSMQIWFTKSMLFQTNTWLHHQKTYKHKTYHILEINIKSIFWSWTIFIYILLVKMGTNDLILNSMSLNSIVCTLLCYTLPTYLPRFLAHWLTQVWCIHST